MNWEYSCGAIVYTRRNGQLLFVVVQEMAGAYSFPKGHMESGETVIQTARREVWEEIGIRPKFMDGFRLQDEYSLAEKPGTRKRVTYFLAKYGDEPLVPRPGEIRDILLLPFEQALACFHRKRTRQILIEANRFLTEKAPSA